MKVATCILSMLLFCLFAYGQDVNVAGNKAEQKSAEIKIYFNLGSYAIDLNLQQNKESLQKFENLFKKLNSDTLSVISKIEIDSYTSPEGDNMCNKKLSKKRSNSIYQYLRNTISVPDSLIEKKFSGTDWNALQELVQESNMQHKSEVLDILNGVPEETWGRVNPNDRWLTLVDSRNKHLMELKWGNPYRWMFANIYPELRNGSMLTIYFKTIVPTVVEETPKIIEIEVEAEALEDPVAIDTTKVEEIIFTPEPQLVVEEKEVRPLFAVKTNLLFDAVTALNIELELPIKQRWSVAGEFINPWWIIDNGKSNSKRHRLQLSQGNVTGKYWFGDRESRPLLTGWFAGLYVGAGLYDFEYKKRGVQGEFFIAGGVAGGYAHTINKGGNLRMEYSLGLGYLSTDYRRYISEYYGQDDWRAIRRETGRYTWIGPTQAKVSLVWMLNYKAKCRANREEVK